jgi:5'-nucleotidase
MRVLVTNDDGYTSVGLTILAQRLAAAGHDVVVAAPEQQQSGGSASLGQVEDGARVSWREVTRDALPGMRVFVIDAPPALSVKAIHSGVFGWKPEVVVSGINYGWNAGGSILHSGTVGAALTACALGMSAVAISCVKKAPEANLQMAADVATSAIELLRGWDGQPVALNINVPNCPVDEVKGVRHVQVAPEGLVDVGIELLDGEMRMKLVRPASETTAEHDSHSVLDGFVSITVHNGRFREVEMPNVDLGVDINTRMRNARLG